MESDLDKINKEIIRYKKKTVSEDLGCSAGHLSYVLNGRRPLTQEMKEKLFEYLKIN